MALQAASRLYNIIRSFNKHLVNTLTPEYYVSFAVEDPNIRERDVWIAVNHLGTSQGWFSEHMVQLDAHAIIAQDKLANKLNTMVDRIMDELNVNTITLSNYANPQSPVDLAPYVLIPRFREMRPLPDSGNETVNSMALDYTLFVYREDVLP
jgi:hypothetical protein